jgi:hypothetical protein
MAISAYRVRNTDQWKQVRSLEYLVYCALVDKSERMGIYEYMPLPGDPTPEQLAREADAATQQKALKWKARLAKYKTQQKQ